MNFPNKPWLGGQEAELVPGSVFVYNAAKGAWLLKVSPEAAAISKIALKASGNFDSDLSIINSRITTIEGKITVVETDVSDIVSTTIVNQDSDIKALQSEITFLEEELAQSVADRVFTDNTLRKRIEVLESNPGGSGSGSDYGRFYVQPMAPIGSPNSGWVNTNNMRLHVWDETTEVWIEVIRT